MSTRGESSVPACIATTLLDASSLDRVSDALTASDLTPRSSATLHHVIALGSPVVPARLNDPQSVLRKPTELPAAVLALMLRAAADAVRRERRSTWRAGGAGAG